MNIILSKYLAVRQQMFESIAPSLLLEMHSSPDVYLLVFLLLLWLLLFILLCRLIPSTLSLNHGGLSNSPLGPLFSSPCVFSLEVMACML